eukprot:CAMPEP_0194434320 /NCGR_PEP_ID=MMETSP0176-20130528/82378_1 /TAXON_ID=216777 /ORGANISM="Proboscia alata, Strain PI-D3" /LENGTH=61 /DNA_ID=CAMNT_0039252515 /DNA_START=50 /DNA_END=232 /DNA_ORIENTATION=+
MKVQKACDILHVQINDATPETIRVAFRKFALKHHPDKNIGHEEEAKVKFQEISCAYSSLKA